MESSGYRSFGIIDDQQVDDTISKEKNTSCILFDGIKTVEVIDEIILPNKRDKSIENEKKVTFLQSNIIGAYEQFQTPFGNKPLIYCDWNASGRGLRNIEHQISEQVLRYYGNTHTTTSITGHQSTCFRHESRQIIAEATNAKVGSCFESIY